MPFTTVFWGSSWFKNPAVWLAESNLTLILETRFFLNISNLYRNIAKTIHFHGRPMHKKLMSH